MANAAATPGVLSIGPKGRVVLTLERRSGALPSPGSLQAAVEAEGGVVVRADGAGDSTRVRYTRLLAAGLLSVRVLENGALLLCASTPEAEPEDFEAAENLCAAVRLEPGR